jgi:hypothetical protein
MLQLHMPHLAESPLPISSSDDTAVYRHIQTGTTIFDENLTVTQLRYSHLLQNLELNYIHNSVVTRLCLQFS